MTYFARPTGSAAKETRFIVPSGTMKTVLASAMCSCRGSQTERRSAAPAVLYAASASTGEGAVTAAVICSRQRATRASIALALPSGTTAGGESSLRRTNATYEAIGLVDRAAEGVLAAADVAADSIGVRS